MRKNLKIVLISLLCLQVVFLAIWVVSLYAPFSGQPEITADGNVWFDTISEKQEGEVFETKIFVDSGDQELAAFGMIIEYDQNVVCIKKVSAGVDGFVAAVNIDNSLGWMKVSGFDPDGKPANTEFHVLTITWEALTIGNSLIDITVDKMVDENYDPIGTSKGIDTNIKIIKHTGILRVSGETGDVNNDGGVDIVDALVVAQYYVGLNPSNFDLSSADTDCDGNVDIVDALVIAQYYVGLISSFPC